MTVNMGKHQVKAIALVTAACLLGDSMLYVVLPVFWREMGLTSLWEVGVLLSVNRFVRLPISPLVGWIYRKISNRTGMLLAVALAVCTTMGYGLAKDFWLLLFLRCLWGIAWTFLRLGAFYTIIDLSEDDNRGYFMGLYNGLYRLGSLFGMLLGGLFAELLGISVVTTAFAIVALFSIPFVIRHVSPNGQSFNRSMNGRVPFNGIWKQRSVIWTLLTALTIAMLFQGVFTGTISELIHIRESEIFYFFNLSIGAAALSGALQALRWAWEPFLAPWFGKLSDGLGGRRSIFVLALSAAALLFALVPVKISFYLWLPVLLGIQLSATVLTTVMDALATDAAANTEKVSFMTAYSMVVDLGAALGPMLAYAIADVTDMNAVYWGAASLLALLSLRWKIPWKNREEQLISTQLNQRN